MQDSERYKLHFGPYRAPRYRVGEKATCAWRGAVTIVGTSSGRIPWPVGRSMGGTSLVLCGDLCRAIQMESVAAVAYWFGVSTQTVTKWRRKLGVTGQQPIGTSNLRRARFAEPWADSARRKAWSKARDPVRREKIAATKRGKPRPRRVIEAMRRANTGRKLPAEHRRKLRAASLARRARPPKAGRPWEHWEDQLVFALSRTEVAARTGRTLSAVQNRRFELGAPDGRRRAERRRLGRVARRARCS